MRNQGIFSHLHLSKSFCRAMGLNRFCPASLAKIIMPLSMPFRPAEALLTI